MSDALARTIAETLLSREGTGAAWGHRIEDAGPGRATVVMKVLENMTNGLGMVHGGMVFALADTAFAYACNSRNVATVSQSASIIHIAPARLGDELVATATEVALAGRSGVYAVTVRVRSGAIIAQFQGHSRSLSAPVLTGQGELNHD